MSGVRLVPIDEIGSTLRGDEAIDAMAVAMEELAICEGLVACNGREHGLRKYAEFRGKVVQDYAGRPCLVWPQPGQWKPHVSPFDSVSR